MTQVSQSTIRRQCRAVTAVQRCRVPAAVNWSAEAPFGLVEVVIIIGNPRG